MIVILILLAVFGGFALAGYIRVAFDPFGCNRDEMPELLVSIILALGFIGLLLK